MKEICVNQEEEDWIELINNIKKIPLDQEISVHITSEFNNQSFYKLLCQKRIVQLEIELLSTKNLINLMTKLFNPHPYFYDILSVSSIQSLKLNFNPKDINIKKLKDLILKMINLKTFELIQNYEKDEDISCLLEFVGLSELILVGVLITNQINQTLSKSKLETLHLKKCKFSNDCVLKIDISELKSLKLSMEIINFKTLYELIKNKKHLDHFKIDIRNWESNDLHYLFLFFKDIQIDYLKFQSFEVAFSLLKDLDYEYHVKNISIIRLNSFYSTYLVNFLSKNKELITLQMFQFIEESIKKNFYKILSDLQLIDLLLSDFSLDEHFIKYLESEKSLTTLTLFGDLKNCYQKFLEIIKEKSKLSVLKLCMKGNFLELPVIHQNLKDLTLSQTNFKDDNLQSFLNSIKTHQNLNSLSLDQNFFSNSFFKLLKDYLSYNPNLKILVIGLYNNLENDEDDLYKFNLSLLFESLHYNDNLESLKLNSNFIQEDSFVNINYQSLFLYNYSLISLNYNQNTTFGIKIETFLERNRNLKKIKQFKLCNNYDLHFYFK